MSLFDPAVTKTLRWEGGYVNNPSDYGGETNFGISTLNHPNEDIRNMTVARAKEIYRKSYWDRFSIGQVRRQELANLVFDMKVNHGRAARIIQEALNQYTPFKVKVDNALGTNTIKALNKTDSNFVNQLVKKRKSYYQSLVSRDESQRQFLTGWNRRADDFTITNTGLGFGAFFAMLGAGFYIFRKRFI